MKYYEVKAKCGHVGRNHYIVKSFYVYASNGREAAHIVRKFPRVKHHKKDAIQNVTEVNYEQFILGRAEHNEDPYFNVYSSTEQRQNVVFEEGDVQLEPSQPMKRKKDYSRQKIIETIIEREWKREIMLYE